MSVREKFVERFGEADAHRIETAALQHSNGVNSANYGSDRFKWVLAITIGYECFTHDGYREYHGIEAPADEIKAWIKAEGDLGSHDGDVDYLSLFAGIYSEYLPAGARDAGLYGSGRALAR